MEKTFDDETQRLRDPLGGEPLDSSGFEDEPFEPDFAEATPVEEGDAQ